MPTLETALFDYLSTDPVLSALVSDRVYPVRAPDGPKLPYIRWSRIDAQREYTYDPFEDTDAWVTARVQFDCWATTALVAMEVGEAVLLALSGYDGDMGGQLVGSSFAVLENDTYEASSKLYRRMLDFRISYEDDLAVSS